VDAVLIYQRAIALIGRQIDGGEGTSAARRSERRLTDLGTALRAGVADRIQHIANSGDCLVRRDAWRRILASNEKGALALVRIGAVPHPAVLLAFADGAGLEQNQPRPSFDRPEGGRRRSAMFILDSPGLVRM
jgi:hypothetical protein